jgi:hypothetical protein
VKQIRKRITYANVMSSIAVFLVLGGATAVAAKKIGSNEIKGNSITTGKIKKNAITTSKIKKNSITTAKVKNGAITGAKVNLGTLGTVPNATHATTADTATTATNFSRYHATGLKKASVGQTVTLLTVGPFTVTGKCKDEGGGYVEATSYITTNQVGSSMYSYEDSYYESDFNPGTEAELSYPANDNSPYIEWDSNYGYYTEFRAASGDGATLLHGEIVNAVFIGGAQCAWWGNAVNDA